MIVQWDTVPETMIISYCDCENGSPKPYCMQLVSYFSFSTLATNEFFQNLEFFRATRLDPTRIVKNVACVIGEHNFVIDVVLSSLTSYSGANGEQY